MYLFTNILPCLGAAMEGLALDYTTDRVYVTDRDLKMIRYYHYPSYTLTTLVTQTSSHWPRDIVLDICKR